MAVVKPEGRQRPSTPFWAEGLAIASVLIPLAGVRFTLNLRGEAACPPGIVFGLFGTVVAGTAVILLLRVALQRTDSLPRLHGLLLVLGVVMALLGGLFSFGLATGSLLC